MPSNTCSKNDLTRGKIGLLLWGLPVVLLSLGLFWSEVRVWLWAPALVVAGVACLANAFRCGRLHCYFTGPLFLLGAAATLRENMGCSLPPRGLVWGTWENEPCSVNATSWFPLLKPSLI